MPRARPPAISDATRRRTLWPEDLANEVALKRAENRIVAEVHPSAKVGVRKMLRGLRRRRFGD